MLVSAAGYFSAVGAAATGPPGQEYGWGCAGQPAQDQDQDEVLHGEGLHGEGLHGEGRFHCEQCGKVYVRLSSLNGHQRFECGKEPQFACPVCPQRFKLKGNLKRHMRIQHNLELPKRRYSRQLLSHSVDSMDSEGSF